MKSKLFAVMCAVIITVSMFVACGTTDKNNNADENKNTVTEGMNEMGQDIKDVGNGMAETAKDAVENTGEAIDKGMNKVEDTSDQNKGNNQ